MRYSALRGDDYISIEHRAFEGDDRLSFLAIGILGYLYYIPRYDDASLEYLEFQGGASREEIEKALQELVSKGYVETVNGR